MKQIKQELEIVGVWPFRESAEHYFDRLGLDCYGPYWSIDKPCSEKLESNLIYFLEKKLNIKLKWITLTKLIFSKKITLHKQECL